MHSFYNNTASKIILFFIFALTIPSIPSSAIAIDGDVLNAEALLTLNEKQTYDFDGMQKRRLIRVLVPFSKTFYFFDGAEPKGISYENSRHFEKFLNTKYKTKNLKIHVLVIPTPRDQLIPNIKEGLGDIAIGNLTITDERLQHIDFASPLLTGIDEVLVSRPSMSVKDVFDLAGKTIHVRKSSSYYNSLIRLNNLLESTEKEPVNIVLAEELLEDEDLLEMVNAGIIPAIIIDSHKANFWKKIFPAIKVHTDIKIHSGGSIAWAIRKDSPLLKAEIDAYVKNNKKGTLTGNVIFNRYLKNTSYITNSMNSEHQQRFQNLVNFFETYGDKYNFDHLMLAALAYQESRLDQSVRSHVGAVGVMQILPSTANDKNVAIKGIDKVEPNIHAGTKYLRFMADRYFAENKDMDTLNRALFAFASYNAGPSKISRLRKEAAKQGLDPNKWFHNVEIIAAKRIGRETVQYVSNIFKYYVAYKMIAEREQKLEEASKKKTN